MILKIYNNLKQIILEIDLNIVSYLRIKNNDYDIKHLNHKMFLFINDARLTLDSKNQDLLHDYYCQSILIEGHSKEVVNIFIYGKHLEWKYYKNELEKFQKEYSFKNISLFSKSLSTNLFKSQDFSKILLNKLARKDIKG